MRSEECGFWNSGAGVTGYFLLCDGVDVQGCGGTAAFEKNL